MPKLPSMRGVALCPKLCAPYSASILQKIFFWATDRVGVSVLVEWRRIRGWENRWTNHVSLEGELRG